MILGSPFPKNPKISSERPVPFLFLFPYLELIKYEIFYLRSRTFLWGNRSVIRGEISQITVETSGRSGGPIDAANTSCQRIIVVAVV